MKVLVVDDSLMILKAVETYLTDMRNIDELLMCSDSTQAIDLIVQYNVDIVIMDVVMPGKSGIELLKEIRQDPEMDDIQVIMLTSESSLFGQCFNLGADDFIKKPFEPAELQARMKAAMKTRENIMMVNDINQRLLVKNDELAKLNRLLKESQFSTIQNEKMASIGELAAGVAQEIKKPLGLIKSNTETIHNFIQKIFDFIGIYRQSRDRLIKTEPKDIEAALDLCFKEVLKGEEEFKIDFILSELEPFYSELQESIGRVSIIVKTLTEFAHTSSDGSFVVNKISKIIEEALLIIRNEYNYIIDIQTNMDSNDNVMCNKVQIEQVLINILMNAIQAIKAQNRSDRGHIEVTTKNLGEEFQISIADDGPGIPEDLFNRIFDPFFTTKNAGENTGLGLSISYDIVVNKHEGAIVVSNDKKGALFEIVLPIAHSYPLDTSENTEEKDLEWPLI